MRAKLFLKKRMKMHTNTIAVQQLSIPHLSNLGLYVIWLDFRNPAISHKART
jgi:hypothetical protein